MAADNFLWFPTAAVSGVWVKGDAAQPKGETQDESFKAKNAFEIKDFSFGVSQAETSGSGTGGASAGRAKFEEFSINRYVDTGSAPLFNALTGGAHFPEVWLCIRKSGGSPLLYLQYVFSQVFVTNISWSGGGGEEGFTESVKFKYGAMAIQYIQQNADGTGGTKMQAAWSVITNTPNFGASQFPKFMGAYG